MQKLFDHLLGFQEHTSQILDFFSTSVKFQDFPGPEKSKLKFQDFYQDPWNRWKPQI